SAELPSVPPDKPSAAANARTVAQSADRLASTVAPSTRKMAERLRRIVAAVNVVNVPFIVNDRRVAMAREMLARSKTPAEHCRSGWVLATELLYDGKNTECLSMLDELEGYANSHGIRPAAKDRDEFRMLRAQAYLRIGEVENCCAQHNADSCLLPLRGAA